MKVKEKSKVSLSHEDLALLGGRHGDLLLLDGLHAALLVDLDESKESDRSGRSEDEPNSLAVKPGRRTRRTFMVLGTIDMLRTRAD